MDVNPTRLLATGLLHNLPDHDWIAIAEILSTLNDDQFETALRAFRLIRSCERPLCAVEFHGTHLANVIPFPLRRERASK